MEYMTTTWEKSERLERLVKEEVVGFVEEIISRGSAH